MRLYCESLLNSPSAHLTVHHIHQCILVSLCFHLSVFLWSCFLCFCPSLLLPFSTSVFCYRLLITYRFMIIFHLFSIAFSFSATFGWDFPRSFRNSVSNSLLATCVYIMLVELKSSRWPQAESIFHSCWRRHQAMWWPENPGANPDEKYAWKCSNLSKTNCPTWTTTCGSGWFRRFTKAFRHSLGPVFVAPTLERMLKYVK